MSQRKDVATETNVEKIRKTVQVPHFQSFPIFKFLFNKQWGVPQIYNNYIDISLTDNSTNENVIKSIFKTAWHSPHSVQRTTRILSC